MSRKFIYFINPISGTRNKAILSDKIKKQTTARQIPFEILPTNAEGNYAYLPKKIEEEKITDIIICGGDGTVNQIVQVLQNVLVNVGIIPLGSGNGLALAAKIPRQADKALAVIFNGNASLIDGFYINKKFGCMLCGLGFDAQVAHDFAKQKKRGLAKYLQLSTKNFFSAGTYPFQLMVEGKAINTESFFISIANSNQFGNHFTIAPRASLQDGLLDVVVVNKMSKLRMMGAILKQIYKGQVRPYEDKKFHRNKIYYFQAKKLQIENPQLAPLHIDGEPTETAAHFEIEVIEKAFSLLMPRQ